MATSPYRMPDPADDEPVVLLERSTRVGRGNKYQALLAAELQRSREAEARAARGEAMADSDADDDDFAEPADNPELEEDLNDEEVDYSDDVGDRPYDGSDADDDGEAQLQREERAARRNKDASLFYLKKQRAPTRRSMRSTFDVDEPSAGEEADANADAAGDDDEMLEVERRRATASLVASTSAGPAQDMLVRQREPRNVRSTYRTAAGGASGSGSPAAASVPKPAPPKPKKAAARPSQPRMTQADRLEAALEMETDNRAELSDWLATEERKRAARRPVPKVVRGPRMTVVSVEGGRKVVLSNPGGGSSDDDDGGGGGEGSDAGARRRAKGKKRARRPSSASAEQAASPERRMREMLLMSEAEGSGSEPPSPATKLARPAAGGAHAAVGPAGGEAEPMDVDDDGSGAPARDLARPASPAPAADGAPSARLEARTLIHLSHPPSAGAAERALLFGDHVDWGQPAPTPVEPETCAITGLRARYKDPRTGLPFADAQAYAEIQRRWPPPPPSPSLPLPLPPLLSPASALADDPAGDSSPDRPAVPRPPKPALKKAPAGGGARAPSPKKHVVVLESDASRSAASSPEREREPPPPKRPRPRPQPRPSAPAKKPALKTSATAPAAGKGGAKKRAVVRESEPSESEVEVVSVTKRQRQRPAPAPAAPPPVERPALESEGEDDESASERDERPTRPPRQVERFELPRPPPPPPPPLPTTQAGPPSPAKSAGGRSHRSSTSTGDELVMEAWA